MKALPEKKKRLGIGLMKKRNYCSDRGQIKNMLVFWREREREVSLLNSKYFNLPKCSEKRNNIGILINKTKGMKICWKNRGLGVVENVPFYCEGKEQIQDIKEENRTLQLFRWKCMWTNRIGLTYTKGNNKCIASFHGRWCERGEQDQEI